jgi:FKBP-type peptidyl-prolyl cis-trans isomerase
LHAATPGAAEVYPKALSQSHGATLGRSQAYVRHEYRGKEEIMALGYRLLLLTGMLTIAVSCAVGKAGNDTVQLRDAIDSLSYVVGWDVGSQLKELGAEIRMPTFASGMQHARDGNGNAADSLAIESIRRALMSHAQQQLDGKRNETATKNKQDGEYFLSHNKGRSGVKTTSSGLQFEVITEGNGPKPIGADSVWISFKGMLIDKTVFTSSPDGQPAVLDLQQAIPGLAEGIRMMKVGSSYRFFVPPGLSYGLDGVPPVIPPNAVLIFEIELVGIIGQQRTAL